MKTMKDRGNTAIPLNDVRSGKSNSAENTNYLARLQRVLVAYHIDRYSLVSAVFRQEVGNE